MSSRVGRRWKCCSFLPAHRFEHCSVLLASNLIFSDEERFFKDPTARSAAVERLAHHGVILELDILSYRMHSAQERRKKGELKK
jgi:hypothetical protein